MQASTLTPIRSELGFGAVLTHCTHSLGVTRRLRKPGLALVQQTDYRYWKRDNPRRLERIDGKPKQWELALNVRERWPDPRNPVRANLDFFIGLRNKVEHRFARDHPALAAAVSGQAQAMLSQL